ncbi:3-carboxy-cis,cis-muconate cycloisomerase [Primorskyibacter aestuariivivens]|uniref:3-carboxy-cis,cis-muconate cycloisomerase n=1 Tax=Primorskyibacter aestuariivivens TaxID=1888912 RepID=UPI0023004069|nr:3-carboxy-cis,cis-muconate cycloisomerase [Primorskyibacter aestuariivivens]MDA7430541.1 3-carboxy-cis,cis-muconate cycloisomerase [Primorskyibacter aestuariivivens]
MIFDHPWLGPLFGDPATVDLWSADAQLCHYRAFEAALANALAACGHVPAHQGRDAAEVVERAEIDIASLAEASLRDGLPIPDFVWQLRSQAGADAAAIHTGATSQDVLDTALALTLRQVTDMLMDRLQALDARLARLASEMGDAPLMGRTRMQAALPITVADRVRSWRQPLRDHMSGLDASRPRVERLQLGGPVGTRHGFGGDGERIAAHMADALGLSAGPVWHTDRSAVAEYASRLSLITGSLGKIGQDVALMAQQGLDEITLTGGGGSSAMPHKSNPVLAELLVTLARFNATQLAGLHHALIHEQERSGAAWMLEWMILPQMSVATARALGAAQDLCSRIERLGS